MRFLVTGGAGFIGSAFVRAVLSEDPEAEVLVLDALTYAGNMQNLATVSHAPNFRFQKGDIRDPQAVHGAFGLFRPNTVVHFAAESHVDRSILAPGDSVSTNVQGTLLLLEAARDHPPDLFIHVSTDEVYGSIDEPCSADESFPLHPSNPYSASKAGSDLLVLAYGRTFSLPVIVTRASNNYGPYQFPEKLIPLMIANALERIPLPVYGDGRQVRDWLHVDDHCSALRTLVDRGRPGQVYNIGGRSALPNLEVIRRILHLCDRPESLIQHVPDRPGHDRRYAMSTGKIEAETGWVPRVAFDDGLRRTIRWYLEHPEWVASVRTGEYLDYYERNYVRRGEAAFG